MIERCRSAWRRFRERRALSLLFDVVLILAVFAAIHAWQTRDLPIDQEAPDTVLALLDGGGFESAIRPGEAGVVYFFAPWCFYCKTSIDNLDDLVADGSVAWGAAIALDYGDEDEVQAFIDKTGVSLPVYMGHTGTASGSVAETAASRSLSGTLPRPVTRNVPTR